MHVDILQLDKRYIKNRRHATSIAHALTRESARSKCPPESGDRQTVVEMDTKNMKHKKCG